MLFNRAVPSGPAGSPASFYTGLELGARAKADRPYVVSNFVSTADGKATADGRTRSLGGEGDRAAFHLLRTQVDAVLAGTGTLRVERYGAMTRDQRLREIRLTEDRDAQPLAVVISRSGQIPFEIPLFADSGSRIALYAPSSTVVPDCAAEVIFHEIASSGGSLADVLGSLRSEHDVRSLLFEGGPAMFNAMLAESLVDELFLTLAPIVVGGHELGITAGGPLSHALPLRLVRVLEQDGHLFLRYARADARGDHPSADVAARIAEPRSSSLSLGQP
jgi:riboflavin biosynthesis pyrimidine reductase